MDLSLGNFGTLPGAGTYVDPVDFALSEVTSYGAKRALELRVTGFTTQAAYDRAKLAEIAQRNHGVVVSSRETNTGYAFAMLAETLTDSSVNVMLVGIAGRELLPEQQIPMHFINDNGRLRVRPDNR
jgi:hypothetical protein